MCKHTYIISTLVARPRGIVRTVVIRDLEPNYIICSPLSHMHTHACTHTHTAVECGSLPNPLNGRVSLTGIEFGSVANYTCNEGYTLQHGDARRRCGPEGEWSGTEPTCRSMSS